MFREFGIVCATTLAVSALCLEASNAQNTRRSPGPLPFVGVARPVDSNTGSAVLESLLGRGVNSFTGQLRGNCVNADFKTAIQNAQKKSSMHATVVRHGTDEALPEFSIDKLIDYARVFPSKLNLANAVVLGVTVSDVQLVDPDVETVDMPPLVQRLKERLSLARGTLAEIDPLIASHQALGLSARLGDLQKLKQELPDRIQDLSDALDSCAKSAWKPDGCTFNESQRAFAVPLLPAHPIVTPFTSRRGDKQRIGVVSPGEERIMLVRGRFDYNNEGSWIDVAPHTQWTFERPDGTATTATFNPPVRFTEPGTVYISVVDSKYDDNNDDGIQAILY